jgi:1-phosphofructokinase family hexose kinase
MGFAGGSGGQFFETLAQVEGLRGVWTRVGGNTRTCVIVVDARDAESTVVNEEGPPVTVLEWARFQSDVRRSLSLGPDIICFSGSLPRDSRLEAWEQLLRTAQSGGRPVWVDTSGEPLQAALRVGGLNIKINGAEMGGLLGRPVHTSESAIEAAHELRKDSASAVVVTLGKEGAVLVDASGASQVRAPVVKPVNAVGSGDAFLGGLLVALSKGVAPHHAVHWGVAAGAANAMSGGGAHFTIEQFQDLLKETGTE